MKLLNYHMAVLFLIFWGNSILFFIAGVPIHIPTNSARGFLFSTYSPILVCCLFDDSPSDRCEVVSHFGFDLHFPDNNAEHLFTCLMAVCISSLKKCLFKSSALLKLGCLFFWCWVVWVLCIFCILNPYQIYHLQISSPIQ